MPCYQVTLQRVMYGYATVTVETDSFEAAEEMAPRAAMNQIGPHDWYIPKLELTEDDLSVVGDTQED